MQSFESHFILSCTYLFFGQNYAQDYATKGYITFDTKLLGSIEKPLILRTFVPTAACQREGISQSQSRLQFTQKWERKRIPRTTNLLMVSAASRKLGKTFVLRLGYHERCRSLRDGWISDMKNYWATGVGKKEGFGYVPRHGFVFYKAQGVHPLELMDNQSLNLEALYVGYSLEKIALPHMTKSRQSFNIRANPVRSLKLSA